MKVCCSIGHFFRLRYKFYSNRNSIQIEYISLRFAQFKESHLKRRGSAHTFAEKLLMKQVAEEFTKRRESLGAKEAAKQLGVSVPSFYNYAAGTDLPRVE